MKLEMPSLDEVHNGRGIHYKWNVYRTADNKNLLLEVVSDRSGDRIASGIVTPQNASDAMARHQKQSPQGNYSMRDGWSLAIIESAEGILASISPGSIEITAVPGLEWGDGVEAYL